MTVGHPQNHRSPWDLCIRCSEFGNWLFENIRTGEWKDFPSSPFPNQYDMGTLEAVAATTGCQLCGLVTATLSESFSNFELPFTYRTHSEFQESVTLECHSFHNARGFADAETGLYFSLSSTALPLHKVMLSGAPFPPGMKYGPLILLDIDRIALLPPPKQPYRRFGRQISSSQCDVTGIQDLYRICTQEHGFICETPRHQKVDLQGGRIERAQVPMLGFRLVDVVDMCVKLAHPSARYVALSYVWGKKKFLKLLKENLLEFSQPGALAKQEIPRTLQDSIELTRCLRERYVWIDALCIVQDDDDIKMDQVNNMDQIYLSATMTIVAADVDSAFGGLTGFTPGSRTSRQHCANIAGLAFVAIAPPIYSELKELPWHQRAWTYQEFMLSKRLLIFTSRRVFHGCALRSYSEDTVMISPPKAPDTTKALENAYDHHLYQIEQRNHINYEREFRYAHHFHAFQTLVQEISSRDLSWAADILGSVRGVLNAIAIARYEVYVCGLPASMLEWALLWQPNGLHERRTKTYDGFPFPSWSWIGWVGMTKYSDKSGPEGLTPIISDWELLVPGTAKPPKTSSDMELTLDQFYSYLLPLPLDMSSVESDVWQATAWRRYIQPQHQAQPQQYAPQDEISKLAGRFSTTLRKFAVERAARHGIQPLRQTLAAPQPRYQHISREEMSKRAKQIDTGILRFTAETATFFVETVPSEFNYKGFDETTACFRITNDSHWVGTVHLPKNALAVQAHLGPYTLAHFVAIAKDTGSYEDTNAIDEGQCTFDNVYWTKLNLPKRELRLFNVIWVRWEGSVAVRVATGQIHIDAWNVHGPVRREILLA
ncbi:HET-domain-containing protein [Amniculicola lignicola CBS 123094]|uniref:HET-domain-containing protein n=1 Tax=Amniculicola lignicola CBS 123094 TaxID=1392246 RepID=A0A6A5WJ47_9PLEO|nr:HET-domain-containing protein [Amniculicola lignicola CBS 123094]